MSGAARTGDGLEQTKGARPARSSKAAARILLDEDRAHRARDDGKGAGSRRGEDEGPARRERGLRALLGALLDFARDERVGIAVALVGVTVSSLFALVPPALTKVAIDFAIADTPGPAGLPSFVPIARDRATILVAVAATVVVAALVGTVASVWAKSHLMRLSNRVGARTRRRVFLHITALPLGKLHAMKSGGTASLLRSDANTVGTLIQSIFITPWRSVVQLVGTLVILSVVDPLFLVGALLLAAATAVSHRAWIGRVRPLWRVSRGQRSRVDGLATEIVSGMRVVRTFRRERTAARQYLVGNDAAVRLEVRAWWWWRGVESLWDVLTPTAGAAVLLYGGLSVIHGRLTLGDVMMFTTYLFAVLGPLEALVGMAGSVQDGLAGLDRVLDVLESPVEHADRRHGARLVPAQVKGELRLEDVRFRYPGTEAYVLDGVTLAAGPGETVALVGSSGAGKSTITHLLARFYDPDEGRVTLDGVDVRDLELDDYRALFGVVEQDVFLFDGTVAENIAFSLRDLDRDVVVRAAKHAAAHAFIEALPDGYDTVIGERGVKLSGGQRQRLAIARALAKDPRILVLDEATSNLDAESERAIKDGLADLLRGRTSFVIAHRLSTIRNASRVVVIEGGRVVESGTHDELLARGGRYAELVAHQVGESVDVVRAAAVA